MFVSFVLPVGIEPTLQAPQACVLSVERREQYYLLLANSLKRELKSKTTTAYLKILKTPVGGAPETLRGALRATVLRASTPLPQRHRQVRG